MSVCAGCGICGVDTFLNKLCAECNGRDDGRKMRYARAALATIANNEHAPPFIRDFALEAFRKALP